MTSRRGPCGNITETIDEIWGDEIFEIKYLVSTVKKKCIQYVHSDLTIGLNAVSYTHLDVYKRQV